MTMALPVPPENLRVTVGPFSDGGVFARSGEEMVSDIVALCDIAADATVLEVGCGCGRLARAFANHIASGGRYHGFDLSREAIAWCRQELQPRLANFRFAFVDVQSPTFNPTGTIAATALRFPYPDRAFDLAVVSSVFTHMLPDAIEHYVAELARVVKRGGRCFITVFLFDRDAAAAVAKGDTIFDFRHPVGPCLAFDRARPEEGVACRTDWFVALLARHGFAIDSVRTGNWRRVRAYEISQDYVVVRKP